MIKPEIIDAVRGNTPLIHHLTNTPTMNFVANGTLAFGASPVMAKSIDEAAQMAQNANAVVLNIGTITAEEIPAMIAAGKTGIEKGIPVLLDPVGNAATSFRADAVKRILEEVKPTVIKGNSGEINFLAGMEGEVKGVDAVEGGNMEEAAKVVAEKYDTAVVVSGKTDVIHVNGEVFTNETGHPYLTKVTGGGCLLGSVIAACLTTDAETSSQLQTAVEFYGRAADYAADKPHVQGPGTFMPAFLDALSFEPSTLIGEET
jgi:hydroxyethylthiazole kinase